MYSKFEFQMDFTLLFLHKFLYHETYEQEYNSVHIIVNYPDF